MRLVEDDRVVRRDRAAVSSSGRARGLERQVGEEEKWKKEFMPGGTYCSSPWLDCMNKNF
jgi:hypothetical protein